MNIRGSLLSVAVISMVGGCATVEDKLDEYQSFSCVELDQEIGKQRYRKQEAKVDGAVADIEGILGDKEEREEADVDGLVADINEDDSRISLKALRQLKADKGCP